MSDQNSRRRPDDEPRPRKRQPTTLQQGWFSNLPHYILITAIFVYVVGWSYISGFYSAFGLSLGDVELDTRSIMIFASLALDGWILWAFLCVLVGFWGLARALRLRRLAARRLVERETEELRERRALDAMALWFAISLLGPGSQAADEQDSSYSAESEHLDARPTPNDRVEDVVRWSRTERLVLEAAAVVFGIMFLLRFSECSAKCGREAASHQMMEDSTRLPTASLVIDEAKVPKLLLTDDVPDGLLEGFHLLAHSKSGYYLFRTVGKVKLIAGGKNPPPRGALNVIFIPERAVRGARIGTELRSEVK